MKISAQSESRLGEKNMKNKNSLLLSFKDNIDRFLCTHLEDFTTYWTIFTQSKKIKAIMR